MPTWEETLACALPCKRAKHELCGAVRVGSSAAGWDGTGEGGLRGALARELGDWNGRLRRCSVAMRPVSPMDWNELALALALAEGKLNLVR